MDSDHRSPVKNQLVETVLFDFRRRLGSAPSAVGDLNRAIWAAISAGTSWFSGKALGLLALRRCSTWEMKC
jgi:hypothetical protein